MQTVPLKDLFDTSYGNKFDLNKMELTDYSDTNCVNFVGRTAKNLGVSAIVKKIENIEPYKADCITVALGGSILSTFIQPKPFYTSQNIMVLIPKKEMTFNEKLFYCICIEKNKRKYSAFGREANRTLKNLIVPAKAPNWISKITPPAYIDVSEPLLKEKIFLEKKDWESFVLGDMFDIKKGKRLTKEDMEYGKTPFIAAIDSNNGYRDFINKEPIHEGNTITVNYNGSVAEAFYQAFPFWASDDVNVLYPKFEMNVFNALFLVTVIKLEKYRFNYGRKWHVERMDKSPISLPAKNGKPDFSFMERYIKTLPYSNVLMNETPIKPELIIKNKANKGLSDSELIEKYEMGGIDLLKPIKKMLKNPSRSSILKSKKKA